MNLVLWWCAASAVMLSSRPDLVSLFASPLCQYAPEYLVFRDPTQSQHMHRGHTKCPTLDRDNSVTPSLTTVWQSMKDCATDKCCSQLNGKHRVSAIIVWMGGVKNNSQRKMRIPWKCLLWGAPDLLWASTCCAHSSPPQGDLWTWAPTSKSSLQIHPGCGTTKHTDHYTQAILIFTHCLNKLI